MMIFRIENVWLVKRHRKYDMNAPFRDFSIKEKNVESALTIMR